jgi:hypothetical protein
LQQQLAAVEEELQEQAVLVDLEAEVEQVE